MPSSAPPTGPRRWSEAANCGSCPSAAPDRPAVTLTDRGSGLVCSGHANHCDPVTRGHPADGEPDRGPFLAIDAGLAAAAPGGYDVIVDFLWGAVAPHAMNHAKRGARYIQVGNSAGAASTITGL